MNLFEKTANFLREVRVEIKKVSWPTRKETITYTLIVIGSSLVLAAFLGFIDIGFRLLLEKFIL